MAEELDLVGLASLLAAFRKLHHSFQFPIIYS